ncbi:unnamed protein product [Rhodiola kirilowii]
MSNLAKLEFSPLDISGKNYMPWTIDIETHWIQWIFPKQSLKGIIPHRKWIRQNL